MENASAGPNGDQYERIRPLYERLWNEVVFVIKGRLAATDLRVAAIIGRAKTAESFREKVSRKMYKNPLAEITDLAGVRVVCYYEADLGAVGQIIRDTFDVLKHVDKSGALGVDKMGYHGSHYVVRLGAKYSGGRYDGITDLRCEIQVRTVLQDGWAMISHHLVYKNEASVPERLRRDLNNVASLLEVAQGVFDSVKEKGKQYAGEIHQKESGTQQFLSQPVDYDTVTAYTKLKFPELPVSEVWQNRLLADLDKGKYKTLQDIDNAVTSARAAVEAYRQENPEWFKFGTDFLTKSLGFVDSDFRAKHPWGEKTILAFKTHGHLVRK